MEILFPREPYLFLGKALPELGELPILPCRGNPVLQSHGEREVQPGAEVLQHVPGGIASEHDVAEIHKGGVENPLGAKGLQCVASAVTCFFPGSEHR